MQSDLLQPSPNPL